MKKFLLILIVAVVALCVAAPAMAGLKLTTKGEFSIDGIYMSKNILDRGLAVGILEAPPTRGSNDSSNAWYSMCMVVKPTLHINDKVRIHARFTIQERNWGGLQAGTFEDTRAAGPVNDNYRGAHNFWWEQLYMSFPLAGGTLYVGRMSGGAWAYPFQDSADNRDRIKYVRKFGHIVVLGLIEKLNERDGGTNVTAAPAAGDGWDTSHGDTNAYAVGSVIPFSKNVIYKPLFYYIDLQTIGFGAGYTAIFMQALTVKSGGFKLDFELNYRWFDVDNFMPNLAGGMEDWDEGMWTFWLDAGMTFGPAEVALGGWYLEGTDSNTAALTPPGLPGYKNQTFWGLGGEFQPLYLLTSEEAGLLWNASGVPNGSDGTSGMEAFYIRGAYKISDSMKIDAILAYVQGNEMMRGTHWNGVKSADDEIGMEFDINFEWKFMPNIKYMAGFAYLDAGDYWGDFGGFGNAAGVSNDNDVWGVHHHLVINW